MKKLIMTTALLFSLNSMANSTAMYATGFIGAAGVIGSSYHGVIANELPEWRRENTHTTARLSQQCGYLWDMRIFGNNSFNYLYINLQKEGLEQHSIDLSKVSLNFNNGIERLAPIQNLTDQPFLGFQRQMYLWISFPAKSDFKGSQRIDVSFPLKELNSKKECLVQTSFQKNPNSEELEQSVQSKSSSTFNLGYGAILKKPKSLSDAQSGDSFIDIGFNGYFNLHHGWGLSLMVAPLGDGNSTTFSPLTGDSSYSPDPHLFGFSFGYAYRRDLSTKWNLTYDLQIGFAEMSYNIPNKEDRESEASFITYQKLSLARRVYRVSEGIFRKDFYLGISGNHLWITSKLLSPLNIKGHIFSTLFFARWEY